MNSDQNMQSLVFADGYSYTEIFEAPETRGMPNSQLISIFHACFTTDRDADAIEAARSAERCITASKAAARNA